MVTLADQTNTTTNQLCSKLRRDGIGTRERATATTGRREHRADSEIVNVRRSLSYSREWARIEGNVETDN